MIFDLVQDFGSFLGAMPAGHPRRRVLALLDEAVRRDVHFIDRHPTVLFQCLWNTCWWYDCAESGGHYESPTGQVPEGPAEDRLCHLLKRWRAARRESVPEAVWLRTMRPPAVRLGSAQRMVLQAHEAQVNAVCCSPDGRWFVSAADDGTVRVWDADTGAQVRCLRGQEDRVTSLGCSPDGRQIACGSLVTADRVLENNPGVGRVWDAFSGEELFRLRGHEKAVSGLSYSPDGRWIATSSHDGTVRLWDAACGLELLRLRGAAAQGGVCFLRDGRRLVSSESCDLLIWDLGKASPPVRRGGHELAVNSVATSPTGRHVASAGWDNTLRLWDADTGAESLVIRPGSKVEQVAFSPDGRLLAGALADKTVRIWQVDGGQQRRCFRGHHFGAQAVAFTPDGRHVLSGGGDQTVRLWDREREDAPVALSDHRRTISCVIFSADGRTCVTGAMDEVVIVWDVAAGTPRLRLEGHRGVVNCVAISPGDDRLASGADDGEVRVWDARTGEARQVLRGHRGPVWAVAYSADGRLLASGAEDKCACLWDAVGGQRLHRLSGHTASVWALAFSPDSARLASWSSSDENWHVWDCARGELLEVIPGHWPLPVAAPARPPGPWRLVRGLLETAVRSDETGAVVGWLPGRLWPTATHPGGTTWAAGGTSHLHLFTLEAETES